MTQTPFHADAARRSAAQRSTLQAELAFRAFEKARAICQGRPYLP